MVVVFFIAAAVAVISTLMVITHTDAVHALLYLVVSFLSVAVIFYLLGAPYIAALEVIIYAGAIMVLFVFVVMMLNLGPSTQVGKNRLFRPKSWLGPAVLSGILAVELISILVTGKELSPAIAYISPKEVALRLFEAYLIGVELSSVLLMTGLIGAYHLGRRWKEKRQ